MVLVLLIGPPAVGKMAVGLELAKLSGLKFFMNHDTIELILKFFDYGTPPFRRLDKEFRFRIFEEVAASDLPGLIFTYVTALDANSREDEKNYLDAITGVFTEHQHSVYYIELYATLEERLQRNRCASRLAAKPSKRDVAVSEDRLLAMEKKYVMNSTPDFPFHYTQNYLKIDSTSLSALEVAQQIRKFCHLN